MVNPRKLQDQELKGAWHHARTALAGRQHGPEEAGRRRMEEEEARRRVPAPVAQAAHAWARPAPGDPNAHRLRRGESSRLVEVRWQL